MKAIIVNDQDATGALRLKILAEGANDRTLLQLLEQQYPMTHRLDSESLEVPIASPKILECPVSPLPVMPLTPAFEIKSNFTVTCIFDPWGYAPLRGVKLQVSQPDVWEVVSLAVNGRKVPDGAVCDVYPGQQVELRVKNRSDHAAFFVACLA